MSEIENIRKETLLLLEYNDYPKLIKKIIDLTLDTEDVNFYRKTVDLLNWLDHNQTDIDKIRDEFKLRLEDIISYLSEKTIPEPQILLEVNNLIKSYSESGFALGPISLKVSEGEIIGLVGENGNGKTTLLRSICQELVSTEGQIKYNFEYSDFYDLRSKLIYIPQRTKDWHGSLLSNLQFTAASYGIKDQENELLVDLIVTRMGLREYRNLKWKSLSSGYKMRFELARMLLRKPKLLLIDEPLANLDILAQQVVLDDFREIAKSPFRPLGIILSSQQLYEVEKTSDQVVFLKQGKPKNLNNTEQNNVKESENQKNQFIIEFESDWNQEKLRSAFSNMKLEKIQLEGGTYIATFDETMDQNIFLQKIVDEKIPLNYFRNISNSTRRFFLS